MWSCDIRSKAAQRTSGAIHLGLMVIKYHEQLSRETGSDYVSVGVQKIAPQVRYEPKARIIERNEENGRCDLCDCRAYWSLYDGEY